LFVCLSVCLFVCLLYVAFGLCHVEMPIVVVCESCGIVEGGTIKLCDFGLAKSLLKEESVATMTTGVGTGGGCWVTLFNVPTSPV
jgi:hypothetical protein